MRAVVALFRWDARLNDMTQPTLHGLTMTSALTGSSLGVPAC